MILEEAFGCSCSPDHEPSSSAIVFSDHQETDPNCAALVRRAQYVRNLERLRTSSAVPRLEASKLSLPSMSASAITTCPPVALAILLRQGTGMAHSAREPASKAAPRCGSRLSYVFCHLTRLCLDVQPVRKGINSGRAVAEYQRGVWQEAAPKVVLGHASRGNAWRQQCQSIASMGILSDAGARTGGKRLWGLHGGGTRSGQCGT